VTPVECASGFEKRRRLGHAAIDLGHGLSDLIAPALVRGGRELAFEFGPREPQRLELPESFRVAHVTDLSLRALAFQLFHPFLYSRIRVD
jgi:hypothetical protein